MVKRFEWIPCQDQGTSEVVRIAQELLGIKIEVTETLSGQGRETEPLEEPIYRFIDGMNVMIQLMSPGGTSWLSEKLHEDLRQVQRLINGNLGVIEPKLEAYKE